MLYQLSYTPKQQILSFIELPYEHRDAVLETTALPTELYPYMKLFPSAQKDLVLRTHLRCPALPSAIADRCASKPSLHPPPTALGFAAIGTWFFKTTALQAELYPYMRYSYIILICESNVKNYFQNFAEKCVIFSAQKLPETSKT